MYGVADTELTAIARVGSGSACRSMYGGYVKWSMGQRDDGADSVAVQVAPVAHWPDIEALILVVNAGKKVCSCGGLLQWTQAHVAVSRAGCE